MKQDLHAKINCISGWRVMWAFVRLLRASLAWFFGEAKNKLSRSTKRGEPLEASRARLTKDHRFSSLPCYNDHVVVEGKLIKGRNLASKMCFPTLNIEYSGELNGVFVGEIFLDGQWRKVAVHLGPRPTINDPKLICEAYVLDWHGQIKPGDLLQIKILKKIREIKKFDSLEQLKDQIASDVEFVKMTM